MRTLEVRLERDAYPVYIGSLDGMGTAFAAAGVRGRAALVSDENVWALHGARFMAAARGAGVEPHPVVVPAGEGSKTLSMLERLYKAFYECGLRRDEAVVTFGGGVVGDLGGFAAATYMRGVPFVQVPTTLLAQVDASVGGKVAVDLPEGKNLVGAFCQPRFVFIDTALLGTLPSREFCSGMAEVVKHAAIDDAELLGILEGGAPIAGMMDDIVYLNVRTKARYVERDERDTGERMMLNFGHTFGHAIEKLHGYKGVTHGEAVAMGMALAARAGMALGVTPPEAERRLGALIDRHVPGARFCDDIAAVIPLMAGDKKNSGAQITLVLLKAMGAACTHSISQEALMDIFKGGAA